MGEAILTRSTTIPEEILNPIYPVEGRHVLLVTLRDPEGQLMQNYPVLCNDGGTSYTYTTNENGQTKFSCNSGAANIYVNNYNGEYQYLDIVARWTNVDAPIGDTSRINIGLTNGSKLYDFTSSKKFAFWKEKVCDLYIVGGGGGGGAGDRTGSDDGDIYAYGGGGGAGYMNNYLNQNLKSTYSFIAGSGGTAGNSGGTNSGGTGGTSYIQNTSYSAVGGSGGEGGWYRAGPGGKGGLGSGGTGCMDNRGGNSGGNSPVSFAGGGGGGGYSGRGGSPGGGSGGIDRGGGGSRGGGGGGGGGTDWCWGGSGGTGLMRINIHY